MNNVLLASYRQCSQYNRSFKIIRPAVLFLRGILIVISIEPLCQRVTGQYKKKTEKKKICIDEWRSHQAHYASSHNHLIHAFEALTFLSPSSQKRFSLLTFSISISILIQAISYSILPLLVHGHVHLSSAFSTSVSTF